MQIRRQLATVLAPTFALGLVAASGVSTAEAPEGCYVAIPGDAEAGAEDVIACELETWIHEDGTKVANLNDTPVGATVTFDTTEPTTSVTGGAGGGHLGSGGARGTGAAELVITGTFTGVIDTIDFTTHVIHPHFEVNNADDVALSITLDGVPLMTDTRIVTGLKQAPNAALPATFQQDYEVSGFAQFMELARLDLSPDAQHTIEITLQPWFIDSGNWAFVYDTTEVPSSIRFNPLESDPDATTFSIF